jgi:Mrp family chromosome partitioning ATPase/capsular polysaccharide biosynthesis protein
MWKSRGSGRVPIAVNDSPLDQRDVRTYLRPVLKRWWLFVLIVPVVTIGTYLYYSHKPKVYESSAQLYVQPSTLGQLIFGNKTSAQSQIENFALLIPTSKVSERAEKLLVEEAEGGKAKGAGKKGEPAPPGAVPPGSVAAESIEKSSFLVVSAQSSTPKGAARLANAYARAFAEMQRQTIGTEAKRGAEAAERRLKRLGKPTEENATRREGLEQQIEELNLIAAQPATNGGINLVQEAGPNAEPIGQNPKGNAIFAFIIGLMLAAGGAYGLEFLNRRIGRIEDAEETYDLPILTEIPQVPTPAPKAQHGVTMAKTLHGPFHRLQTNLEMQARERPLRTIVVASAAPGEGKSIVARNLALAYSEAGRRVAVLDADLRKASMGGLLAAHDGLGLSDILSGRASFGDAVQEVAVQVGTNGNSARLGAIPADARPQGGELAMVPAGEHTGNLAMALSSDEMRQALSSAAEVYGTVIIDSPPILAVADGLPLLSEADAVVLVTRLGVSTRDSARRVLAELRRVPDVYVAGIVVNGISPRVYRARSYGYYYS